MAVLLNDAAARYAAEQAGVDNTEEFRAAAARIIGRAVVERTLSRSRRFDPFVMVNASDLREMPELLAGVSMAEAIAL